MSCVEEECRWSIVEAWVIWALQHNVRPFNLLAYGRALGLDFF
jgi:hypothetical protein